MDPWVEATTKKKDKKKKTKPKVTAGLVVDLGAMPALSQVDVLTGVRTGPQDILNERGLDVGSKVCSNLTRGIYNLVEIRTKPCQTMIICLELLARTINMKEVWEWLQRPADEPVEVPAAEPVGEPPLHAAAKSKEPQSHPQG